MERTFNKLEFQRRIDKFNKYCLSLGSVPDLLPKCKIETMSLVSVVTLHLSVMSSLNLDNKSVLMSC